VDISESGSMNPQINTSIAVNPDSELIPVTRANGITHVLTVPGGGVISGTSALIRLDGWTWEDVTALSPAALHLRWPSFRIRTKSFFGPPPPSEEDQKKEREEQLRAIDEFFDDARAYAKAKAAEGDGSARIDVDPALEAMLAVLDGSVPVMVHAGGAQQIKSALEWFDDQDELRMILVGSGDVWRLADMLADRNVPVILASVLRTPSREDEPYDTPYTIAAKLHAAGVKFAISTGGGSFGSSNTRNLPYHAAMAAAFGLPHDVALKSVMTYPAEILGVGDVLGTIEPGKSASLIITDGDPLEITTQVEGAFIDGRAVELERNRHFELFTKYSNRPRAE
jgi:imidazolonepropionase-like amidohydrolase